MPKMDHSEIEGKNSSQSSTSEQEITDLVKPQKTPKIPAWLPDWKEPESYPDPNDKVSSEQWAWEFLRRNPRYQYLYRIGRRHRESWYKTNSDDKRFSRYFKCVPKVNKGESYDEYLMRCKLANVIPKIIAKRQRILDIFPVIEVSQKLDPARTKPPKFNRDYGYPICNEVSEDEEEITFSVDGVDEVFIVFSAALPIKAQIQKAEKLLLEQQKYYEEQGHQLLHRGRVPFQTLRNYLRYLDGELNGATQVEIARVVHPKDNPDTAKQKVNKGIKTARYYRDIGYLKILGTEILN